MTVPPARGVDLVLDTDIGTDVDDAYALAFALRHPAVRLRAVTTVSGDTALRGRIARKLCRLAGRDDVEIAAGQAIPEGVSDRPVTFGHEGEGLLEPGDDLTMSSRDAVTLLVEEAAAARDDGRGLALATVGMQTNLAAALDRDPAAIRGGVGRLAVMGGVFGARKGGEHLPPGRDHNLAADPPSAERALNAGLDVLYVPLEVTIDTLVTRDHLRRLRGGDPLCRALAALTERWAVVLHRRGAAVADEQVAALHDPLTVASLVESRFVTVARRPVTVALTGGLARSFVDPVAGTPADVVTSVDAAGFAGYWLDVVTSG